MDKQQNILIKSYIRTRKERASQDQYPWTYSEAEYLQKTLSYDKLIELDAFHNADQRADYLNRYIVKERRFHKVYRFDLANKTIATAVPVDMSRTYINREGEESAEGVTSDEFEGLDDLSQRLIASIILGVNKYDVEIATPIYKDSYQDLGLNFYIDDFISILMKNGDKLAIDKNMQPANRNDFLINNGNG